MMVSVAVVVAFVAFAAVLFWADQQSNSSGGKPATSGRKRRSF